MATRLATLRLWGDDGRSSGSTNALLRWVEPRGLEPLTPTLPVLPRFCRAVPAGVLRYRDLRRLTSRTAGWWCAVVPCPVGVDLRCEPSR
jgi:hypothetical protein